MSKGYLYGILPTTPFLLGNSAGGLGALIPVVIGGGIVILGVIGASIWAIIKFFR